MYYYSSCYYHHYYTACFRISVKTCHSNNSALTIMVTFKNIFLTLKNMFSMRHRARTLIYQLAKILKEVLWRLTPSRIVKLCFGSFTCCFHIRPFPFYGTNTKLSQLSIFHSVIKCYDNISLLCRGVKIQCKDNDSTFTPWNRHWLKVRVT